jgi:hypothetical protein
MIPSTQNLWVPAYVPTRADYQDLRDPEMDIFPCWGVHRSAATALMSSGTKILPFSCMRGPHPA